MKIFKTLIPILAVLAAGCNKDDVVIVEPPDDDGGYRPVTGQSSAYQSKVYEYLPAPGQFINETVTGGFTGDETTMGAAILYAEKRLSTGSFVSLGAFGGYIVVGFDHSILRTGGKGEIAILGNAIEGGNEPGIVWVMQDRNRNGLPDDEWYELRGSEYSKASTLHGYSVTYYRPESPNQPVEWKDSEGNTGSIDYLNAYHKQPYYYPAWIKDESYTLTGTRLEARNTMDPATGNWINAPYDWGYVDNLGSDACSANNQWVRLSIGNAVKSDGSPVKLEYIDFVKVQSAVLAKSGWIGENSSEVLSIADASMLLD